MFIITHLQLGEKTIILLMIFNKLNTLVTRGSLKIMEHPIGSFVIETFRIRIAESGATYTLPY